MCDGGENPDDLGSDDNDNHPGANNHNYHDASAAFATDHHNGTATATDDGSAGQLLSHQ